MNEFLSSLSLLNKVGKKTKTALLHIFKLYACLSCLNVSSL